jgi:hypothetical protein
MEQTAKLSMRLPRELRRQLEREAAADQRPLTQLIRKILVEHARQAARQKRSAA